MKSQPLKIQKKKILEKIEATEQIELDLPDPIFMALAMKAHQQGITLNKLVQNLLGEYIHGLQFVENATDLVKPL
jgi:predicted HicB family RNase H-like nuclease